MTSHSTIQVSPRGFLADRARRAVAAVAGALLLVTGAGLVALGSAEAATPTLPFDLVQTSGSKVVFAHYFTPYPVSLDNQDPSNDYYARNYLNPNGESGKHAAYGGLLRDRPLTHAVRSESTWLVSNMQDEIAQAKAAGINAFIMDIMVNPATTTNTNLKNAQANLMTAADSTGFSVMLMPDMTAGIGSLSAADLAAVMNTYATHKSAYKLADGRLVISPFKAEVHTAAWWSDFLNIMKTTYGTNVAFVPTFLNEATYESSFASISYGMSEWGSRNPAWNDPSTTGTQRTKVSRVHSLGKIWMQPVSVQDERPNQSIYDEAQNTQNMRNTWKIAIDSGSEWVQLTTWNDYSEGAQVAPSVEHGWTFTDLAAYYGQWFRTGSAPAIVRDAVYLTHRKQPYAATPTFAETSLMKLRGGSPSRDTVEALSMLTAPATVSITVGGVTTSCSAPAGVSVCTVPLQLGRAAVAVVRNGAIVASVATRQTITATPYVQDLQYVGAGSLRDGPADPSRLGVVVTPSPTPTTPTPTTASPTPTPSPTTTTATPTPTPTPTATTPTPTPTAGSTSVTLEPIADAYANSGAPTTNYGAANYLGSRSGVWTSFLRYAFPATPVGKKLVGATFSVRTTSDPTAVSTGTHQVTIGSDSWSESTLTWNNRPSAGTTLLGTLSGMSANNTDYSAPLDASALAAAYPATGGQLSLAVSSTATDGAMFGSREFSTSAGRPDLTLVYAPVVDTAAPSAPGAPKATVVDGEVDLSWAASSDDVGVTEYDVYRSDEAGTEPSPSTLIATTSSTSYVDTDATVGTWYYRVVAADAAGHESVAGAETTVLVPDTTAPTAVVVRGTVNAYDVELGWTEATDDVAVVAYRIYRSATAFSPSPTTLVSTTTGRSFVDTARPVGTWYYAVVAVDAAGNTSVAAATSARVLDVTAPDVPTPSVEVAASTVTVTWPEADDNVATTRYDVYRSAAPFVPDATSFLGSTATTAFVDGSAPYGAWYYEVVAVDAAGNRSAASAAIPTVVVDTVPPSAPTVSGTGAENGTVSLTWTGATDDVAVAAYEVHRSRSPFTPSADTLVGTSTSTAFTDAGRAAGTWYYAVIAIDAAGNRSAPSSLDAVYVPDVVAPTAPTVTASASGSTVSLSWTESTDDLGVTGYTVSRLVGSVMTQVGSVTGTTFTESVADGSWLYLVTARDAAGNVSDAGSVTVSVAAPLVEVLRPTDDAWANASAPTRNYGSSTSLTTRGTKATVSYLKFAMPTAPVGRTLATAVLTIRTLSSSGSGSTTPQYVRITTDGWTEGTLTWNNRPSSAGTLVGTLSSAPAVSTSYRVGLVGSTLLASRTSSGRVSLAIVTTGRDLLCIGSSESTTAVYQPTLTVTWK